MQCRQCGKSFSQTQALAVRRARKYQQQNKNKVAVWDRKYRLSENGHAKRLANSRKYRQTEKGRRVKQRRKFLERNPDAGQIDFEAWHKKLFILGGKCQVCFTTEDITADHMVPLSRGGTNHIDNLQPLCRSCNCSKGNKTWVEYLVTVGTNSSTIQVT